MKNIWLEDWEKNIKQQFDTNKNWDNVDWFLHTWGFLPASINFKDKLTVEQSDCLIVLALDWLWRKTWIDDWEQIIKRVQEYLVKCNPEFNYYFK